ncbi:MAG: nucleotidyltransferase family protein [Candidatus Woesearchaeota archaeon]
MKAIILAAGYATRLYPLTENMPKPLITINKKPMIEYVIDKIQELGINEIYVVTNAKFYKHFTEWSENYQSESKIIIVNDNTTSNDDRLGAIGDIDFTIKNHEIDDDLLVIGADNLFKFSLKNAYETFKQKQKTTIVAYDVKDIELAKKYGVIEIDSNKKVLSFIEKPEQPKSTLCAICVYFYPKETIEMIDRYLNEGNNKDAPGNLPAWLIKADEVYAESYSEAWYDVGGFESLKEAKEEYGEINVDIEKLKKIN